MRFGSLGGHSHNPNTKAIMTQTVQVNRKGLLTFTGNGIAFEYGCVFLKLMLSPIEYQRRFWPEMKSRKALTISGL